MRTPTTKWSIAFKLCSYCADKVAVALVQRCSPDKVIQIGLGLGYLPQIGDVVIVRGPEFSQRCQWKYALVMGLPHSHDGVVRSVELKLPSGRLTRRSLHNIYPLECKSSGEICDIKTFNPSQSVCDGVVNSPNCPQSSGLVQPDTQHQGSLVMQRPEMTVRGFC